MAELAPGKGPSDRGEHAGGADRVVHGLHPNRQTGCQLVRHAFRYGEHLRFVHDYVLSECPGASRHNPIPHAQLVHPFPDLGHLTGKFQAQRRL